MSKSEGMMKMRCALFAVCLVLGMSSAPAWSHDGEKHEKTKPVDARMKKLHDMMPVFAVATTKLEEALARGDAAAVEAESARILGFIPDLKQARPHKNLKQRGKFVALAKKQEQSVTAVVALAKRGDFAGARAAFKQVTETCAECHVKFRD